MERTMKEVSLIIDRESWGKIIVKGGDNKVSLTIHRNDSEASVKLKPEQARMLGVFLAGSW